MLQRGNRVFNIDPPTSLTPSCGGPRPYRGENSGSGRRIKESLTSGPELENSLSQERLFIGTQFPCHCIRYLSTKMLVIVRLNII